MNVKATLNSKTVAELRKIAACYDIAGRSTMKKADLIDRLIDSGVETRLAIDEITPEQEAAYAEQYNAAKAKRETVNEVAVLRDAPGTAIVTAAFDGKTVRGFIVREGRRFVLTFAGSSTVTGSSYEKVAKRFAAKLGFRADVIDVSRSF